MTAYLLVLPYARPPMTANQARSRTHWTAQRDAKAEVEQAVWALAKQQRVPRLDRCTVALTWYATGRGRRDPDSLGPMVKASLDGLTCAGVLQDDDSTCVAGVLLRVVTGAASGRVELALVDSDGPECFAELLAA